MSTRGSTLANEWAALEARHLNEAIELGSRHFDEKRGLIERAIAQAEGNKAEAARLLGCSSRTVFRFAFPRPDRGERENG